MLPLRLLVNMAVQAKTNTKMISDALVDHPDIPESIKSHVLDVADFAHASTEVLSEVLSHLIGG